MATAYRTLTFTTGSIAAGASSSRNDAVVGNSFDIVKIKVVPSVTGALELSTFEVFNSSSFSATTLCYATNPFLNSLIDPIQFDGATNTERNEGFVATYWDADLTALLHSRITNNGTLAKTYTITITYRSTGVIDVTQFGAIADGSTDNTVAIQAAFDSIPTAAALYTGGSQVIFPQTAAGAVYCISDTIHIGRFSLRGGAGNAANDVLGFASTKRGCTINGMGATIKWIGTNQAGDNKIVKTDSTGTYDLITNDKPMFSVVACHNFTVRDLRLDGNSLAYSPIWFQGNHNRHHFSNVSTTGFKVGWRHGCAWDVVGGAAYYGYGNSPYYKLNVYNMVAVGGWQGDTQSYTSCSFRGSISGFSTESGQNLGITMNSTLINEGEPPGVLYGITMIGGRLTANGLSVVAAGTYDVWMITGANYINVTDWHSESGVTFNFRSSTALSTPVISVNFGDNVKISLPSAGAQINLNSISNAAVTRGDGDARCDIAIRNSYISGLALTNTTARSNLNIALDNCNLGVALSSITETNCYTSFRNCQPVLNQIPYAIEWGALNEFFHGNVHHCFSSNGSVAVGVATKMGTIATSGSGNAGHCLLRVNISAGTPAANVAACFGLYQFSWVTDTTPTVTVSAVDVIKESKALDAIAALTPTVTLVVSGANIEVKVAHANTPNANAAINLYAEIYSGGLTDITAPIWTKA